MGTCVSCAVMQKRKIELELKAEGIISMYHGQLLPFIKKYGADQCQAFKRRIKVAC